MNAPSQHRILSTGGGGASTLQTCNCVDHLRQSSSTHVFRGFLAGMTERYIFKEFLVGDRGCRASDERRMLAMMSGIDGVLQLVPGIESDTLLVFGDYAGVSLASRIASTKTDRRTLLELALDLAATIEAIHARGVLHNDINPSNILVDELTRAPRLIDFQLATTFAAEQPTFARHYQVAGTLRYVAPEQTGRTGHAVDQRTDLYSLGATLYEVAVGHPPFCSDDPLQLIHDHLIRVPPAPDTLEAGVGPTLSGVIMRLLEKEPERRYQSALGLMYDLRRMLACGEGAAADNSFVLGERDFPMRLAPPSALIGRDAEIAALKAALEGATKGQNRAVFVDGPSGVGKTVLIGKLRSMAVARNGLFLGGKFDRYQRGSESAVVQSLRSLGRLLLAESERELEVHRRKLLEILGPSAPLIAAALPEFAVVLQVAPDATRFSGVDGDARMRAAMLECLRCIASDGRPIVIVLDDLQWADRAAFEFIEDVLMHDSLPGLLLVGAYRRAEIDALHPLAVALPKWLRLGVAPSVISLKNLEALDLASLLTETLRLEAGNGSRLAHALADRTNGNPHETIEFVNALRREGVLSLSESGWVWEAAAISAHVDDTDRVEAISTRLERLPASAQQVLFTLSCVGGQADLELLVAASGLPTGSVAAGVRQCLKEGFVVRECLNPQIGSEPGGAIRFHRDCVQQATHAALKAASRAELQLSIARRLVRRPGHRLLAAELYLKTLSLIDAPFERRLLVDLFREGATHARLVANYAAAERLLDAGLRLLHASREITAPGLAASMQIDHHSVLARMGRIEDADRVFKTICARDLNAQDLVDPTCMQIVSLTNRGLATEALALGLGLVDRLDLRVPFDDFATAAQQGIPDLYRWLDGEGAGAAPPFRKTEDPRVIAIAKLFNQMLAPAYFADQSALAWIVFESRRMWAEHGACAPLVAPLAQAAFVIIGLCNDYRVAYAIAKHAFTTGDAQGWKLEAARARFVFAVSCSHWLDRLEDAVAHSHLARDALLQGGDPQFACFCYHSSIPLLLDCTMSLDKWEVELAAGIALADRAANEQSRGTFASYGQLLKALRGQTHAPGSLDDEEFDAGALATPEPAGMAAAHLHVNRAFAAAIFGDEIALSRHIGRAMPLLSYIVGCYPTAVARLLNGLALSSHARCSPASEHAACIAGLVECRAWMAHRASDSPAAYGPWVDWLDAELAWARDAAWDAARAFDVAMTASEMRVRPWAQALLLERAAAFHRDQGMAHQATALLRQARDVYSLWGATGKVAQLDDVKSVSEKRTLPLFVPRAAAMSGDSIDVLALLRASQELSSETSLDNLKTRIVALLATMTGATQVHIVLRRDNPVGWHLLREGSSGSPSPQVSDPAVERLLPTSAFRYALRTATVLLVDDATRDERFSSDPYIAALDRCSLLIVPILSHGTPRAMLLLENTHTRNAFSAERLEAITLIAGQLAISFDNALLYDSLDRTVNERTSELAEANRNLEQLAITDPLTGLANRRHFVKTLEAEWLRAMRSNSSIGLAMIDVDQFKLYNDHFGHIAGDACLQLVAKTLGRSVRPGSDLVARYGGEEFVMVLPNSDPKGLRVVAERVRKAVHTLREPHPSSQHGVVTISVGAAAFHPSSDTTVEAQMKRADAALYEAKRNGRNRVEVALQLNRED